MDSPRRNKGKKKAPRATKTPSLPKLDTMTREEREQLYHKNFQELAVLRRSVYSSLNVWPGNTFLPGGATDSGTRCSTQQPQNQQQRKQQATGLVDTAQQQQQQQLVKKYDHRAGDFQLKHSQQLQQQQPREFSKHQQPPQKPNRKCQTSGRPCENSKPDVAILNGWSKDLSENINFHNVPDSATAASSSTLVQGTKQGREPGCMETSESESDGIDVDMDSSDCGRYERF